MNSPAKCLQTLKNRRDYLRVHAGKKVHTRAFVLQTMRRVTGEASRFGFTVTKRIGNAVERNRIKRRLKSAVRACLDKPIAANRDHVLIGKRGALSIPFGDLVHDLENALTSGQKSGKRSS